MMKPVIVCWIAASLCSRADVIFDTSPPNSNAFDIVDSRLASGFTFNSSATITGINFWYQAQFETDLTTVAYAFYADSGGQLGSVVASGLTAPATSTDAANNAFLASFNITSLSLASGSYWLELHSGTNLMDTSGFTVWWAATDVASSLTALSDPGTSLPGTPIVTAGYTNYAFQLLGTGGGAEGGGGSPTPEPSTGSVVICTVVAVSIARLRARRLLKQRFQQGEETK